MGTDKRLEHIAKRLGMRGHPHYQRFIDGLERMEEKTLKKIEDYLEKRGIDEEHDPEE
ncbi:MAG: hypothetical protein KGJ34_02855 [Patescibacteria group bacterium]|nr:hypothetical protein [Patescibacteria group bacterium]